MRRDLTRSAIVLIVFTVLLGLVYPLAVTGIAQIVFKGNVVTEPDPRYFQPRPSATGYSATVTYFPNRGPNQASTRDLTRQHLDAYLALERPYAPDLKASRVPVDAVTFSASGVDPQISQANAAIQAHRVAAARKLSLTRVHALIHANTAKRALGIFGEPGVNVTDLNLALDREAR